MQVFSNTQEPKKEVPNPESAEQSSATSEKGETKSDIISSTLQNTDQQARTIAKQINGYFPHPLVSVLVAITVFIALGKLVDWFVTVLLAKLVERTDTGLDDKVLAILHRPIFLSVVLVGLDLAVYLLDQPENVTRTTVNILQTIAVLIWFRFGLKLIRTVLDEFEKTGSRVAFVTSTTKPLLVNTFSILLVAASVYIVFLIWNINITAWIASAGIIGLAVSFAAKDTLANIFGGVTIFADKPFKVGDYVVLDGGERGMITQIGVRSTRILTRDDVEITVPNGILATTTIINESGGPHEKFRIRVKIGVAYGSDLDTVEESLIEVANQHPDVCSSPEPRVRLRGFGDFSLDHELLCWVDQPVLRGRVVHELNRNIYKAFQTDNIEIPFPRQDIYVSGRMTDD